MEAFINILAEKYNIKQDTLVIMKRNPMLNHKDLDVLSDQKEKKLNQLRVNEGVNLFVEDKDKDAPASLS